MAFGFNNLQLGGTLGNELEVKELGAKKTPMCELRIAENYRKKVGEVWEDETRWHTIKFWGENATKAASRFVKGDGLFFDGGKIETRKVTRTMKGKWTNPKSQKVGELEGVEIEIYETGVHFWKLPQITSWSKNRPPKGENQKATVTVASDDMPF